jgi:hypothetical protein
MHMLKNIYRALQNTWDELAVVAAACFGGYMYSLVPPSILASVSGHIYAVFVAVGCAGLAFVALYLVPRFGH